MKKVCYLVSQSLGFSLYGNDPVFGSVRNELPDYYLLKQFSFVENGLDLRNHF